MVLLGQDFWRSSGWHLLEKNKDGWLTITDDFLAAYFARPELAPIKESCQKEIKLHEELIHDPHKKVDSIQLSELRDQDAAFNYKVVLSYRDFLLGFDTVEGAYLAVAKGQKIDFPPLFIDHIAHVIIRSIVDSWLDPIHLRASEILFREQSVTLDNGRIMLADRATVQFQTQQQSSVKGSKKNDMTKIDVLTTDTCDEYWSRSDNFDTAIDIAYSQPALDGIARVLEGWISHFLKVITQIRPMSRIDDEKWKWHVGLDASSNAILNDLYNGKDVPEERLRQILALFSLVPDNPRDFKKGLGENPIYLGLSMSDFGVLSCKPQNLLVNLPIIF